MLQLYRCPEGPVDPPWRICVPDSRLCSPARVGSPRSGPSAFSEQPSQTTPDLP